MHPSGSLSEALVTTPGTGRFEDEDFTDAEFRECDLTPTRLIGVVMQDAVIDGLVSHLMVNGVEVSAYVGAELDRRHPVRLLIRSPDPADLRQAHDQLRTAWHATVERLRGLPEGSEHRRGGGEWSAVQTLRHLVFVHDSWFRHCCLGSAWPFTALGLASPFVPDQQEQGLNPAADQDGAAVPAGRAQRGSRTPRLLRPRPRAAHVAGYASHDSAYCARGDLVATSDGCQRPIHGVDVSLLALMAEGLSNSAIASRLLIIEGAVSKYTTSTFDKLGIHDEGSVNRRVRAVLTYLELRDGPAAPM